MILLSGIMKTVSLTQLLSSCMDASYQGCQIIRDYYSQAQLKNTIIEGKLKESNEVKSVVTQADINAQAIIVGGLRKAWGGNGIGSDDEGMGLNIIGEEDENDAKPNMNGPDLKMDLLDGKLKGQLIVDEEIPINELTLFVDPLDGTREFVEGRLQNVACLIGITRHSRPIAGIIAVPFPNYNPDNANNNIDGIDDIAVYYAISDQPLSSGCWIPTKTSSEVSITTTAASTAAADENNDESPTITILTGDSRDPVLINATKCAKSIAQDSDDDDDDTSTTKTAPTVNHIIVGGTAAKLRWVATQSNCLAILHFKTELWDTCAPQSIIESNSKGGGKVTDLFGTPLVHSQKGRPFGNVFGVVASSGGSPVVSKLHDELCAKMRADVESVHKIFSKWMTRDGTMLLPTEPQAMDVVRDLNGLPLSVTALEKQILKNFPSTDDDMSTRPHLKSYTAPESGVWRGMMSTGCRLLLNWEEKENEEEEKETSKGQKQSVLPRSVFYKRIVMSDLSYARNKLRTAPHKILRDVKSYQIETSFLTSRACQEGLIREANIRINQVYHSDLRPASSSSSSSSSNTDIGNPKEQLESKFAVLLEDFDSTNDDWYQYWLLDEEAVEASLQTLANLHAYFWTGSDFWKKDDGKVGQELEACVWPNGGYMQPALQGYEQLNKIVDGWTRRYPTFEKDVLERMPNISKGKLQNLGERLQDIANDVGSMAHPFQLSNPSNHDNEKESKECIQNKYRQYRTFIHGDPKQPNIFFRRRQEQQQQQQEQQQDGGNKNDDNDDDDDTTTLEVALIDFQWCGFGLAATDVAHHLAAAVQARDCLSLDGARERRWLDHYHSCLAKKLVEYGVAPTIQDVEETIFPRKVLQEQYEIALLDICRMVIAYAWARWKDETNGPTPESFNRNSYNKSLDSAIWLICRCYTLLESFEEKKEQ